MAAGEDEPQAAALDVEAGQAQGDSQLHAASAGGLHHRSTTATDGAMPPAASDSQVALADAKPTGSTNLSDKAGGASEAASEDAVVINSASYWEIAKYFGILGWTAFGGPAAHVAMFQKLFVDRLRWCTYLVFTELLMLGQCMPGPTSTQMGFAIGVLKKGLSGGLLSGVLFQGPGFLILAILGWVASKVLDNPPEWLEGLVAGLAAAGIALVASAALHLVRNICKGRLLQVLCTGAAIVAFYWPKPWTFPALIVIGGLVTLVAKRQDVIKVADMNAGVDKLGFNKLGGGVLLAGWIVILVVLLVLAGQISYEDAKELHWAAVFWRTGSIIFGGGQVVLPMIYNDVVDRQCITDSNGQEVCTDAPDSWMTTEQFYAGLALAQAMPGPLFNFAAYLGAVIAQNAGVNAIIGVLICWFSLFGPGIILIFGILPFWGAFRKWQVYRRALPGLNATAVGLIVTSVFQLTLSAYDSSPFPTTSICIGMLAYGFTEVVLVPAPFVVIGGGALGVVGWAANMK